MRNIDGETCDDGNNDSILDGCRKCQVDTGYTCVPECNEDENFEKKCFEKCEPFIVMNVSGEP
jgi:hypothetical protein